MARERWKDIDGYEGRYQVSDHGRVRSLPRVVMGVSRLGNSCARNRPGKVLKLYPINSGYLIVHLSRGFRGGRQALLVHRLVGKAFCGLPDDKQINHDDLVKTNNFWRNLGPMTPKQNTQHAIANGRQGGGRRAQTLV